LPGQDIEVRETAERIVISTPQLQATVNKKDYVTGIAGGSFVGFFDSVEEMLRVYDQYAGAEEVVVNDGMWNLRK
jgi:hypothetical protein